MLANASLTKDLQLAAVKGRIGVCFHMKVLLKSFVVYRHVGVWCYRLKRCLSQFTSCFISDEIAAVHESF